jgi:hypothetical protein
MSSMSPSGDTKILVAELGNTPHHLFNGPGENNTLDLGNIIRPPEHAAVQPAGCARIHIAPGATDNIFTSKRMQGCAIRWKVVTTICWAACFSIGLPVSNTSPPKNPR